LCRGLDGRRTMEGTPQLFLQSEYGLSNHGTRTNQSQPQLKPHTVQINGSSKAGRSVSKTEKN